MKDRIARIFYNREELRIRAGWRILLFMPILIGAAFALLMLWAEYFARPIDA